MVDRLLPDAGVGVADAAEHVVVVLEGVRVDRAERDTLFRGVPRQVRVVVDLVPGNVERNGGRDTREAVDLCRVVDLLVGRPRDAFLTENVEPGSGVAEGP